jgi:hypothetical protein
MFKHVLNLKKYDLGYILGDYWRQLGKFFAITAGVDVMITIFCGFCRFSAKKLAFFSKTNVMINYFSKTSSSLSKKRQYFRHIFRQKYF